MEKDEFIKLLDDPTHLTSEDVNSLKSVTEEFPYFQSARALYLKGLKNIDSYKYNNSLKKTAAYTTDRSVLFDFITSEVFNQNAISKNIKQNSEYLKQMDLNELDDISVNKSMLIDEALKTHIQNTEGVLDPDLFKPKETEQNSPDRSSEQPIIAIDVENIAPEETLELGKPLEFDSNETHSFAEWLKITDFKPIDRGNETSNDTSVPPITSKLDLIDKFIEDNPKIVPKEEQPTLIVTQENLWKDEGLMTETLARIYLEQKNYNKAIQSYRILSLKYPEKSSFFADQIKAVEAIQLRNS
ncbi:hypothetical protein [Winogradskyella aurantiaca]|uniref:hypothetical protein n=1 Tax=Winogradskyella aurantiaca TaxID=2219558 RepID=UPI000E1D6678|nr:hypothetical protein [Winogradskyella aurantiaca]